MTDNPNAPNNGGETPINYAAALGYTEIVKIIAPLTDNPNAPDKNGHTPIFLAAKNGHTEIVKILAPLTANPNAPNNHGITPIKIAKNAEMRRILRSFQNSKKRKAKTPAKPSTKRVKKF